MEKRNRERNNNKNRKKKNNWKWRRRMKKIMLTKTRLNYGRRGFLHRMKREVGKKRRNIIGTKQRHKTKIDTMHTVHSCTNTWIIPKKTIDTENEHEKDRNVLNVFHINSTKQFSSSFNTSSRLQFKKSKCVLPGMKIKRKNRNWKMLKRACT